ncbi:Hypothetical Protein RSKD131_4515 (plasmid) [Cereibacter sphaeroides KD131]|nr:Hypothetical Protein RSKD131_4515 [Cereibacter sphaeroides KD131]
MAASQARPVKRDLLLRIYLHGYSQYGNDEHLLVERHA